MTAYVVVDVDIEDAEAFAEYRALAIPSVEQHGARVLARSDEALALEGGWHPRRIVVLAFETLEAARRWHTSPQ